jgi:hypothetical protein
MRNLASGNDGGDLHLDHPLATIFATEQSDQHARCILKAPSIASSWTFNLPEATQECRSRNERATA